MINITGNAIWHIVTKRVSYFIFGYNQIIRMYVCQWFISNRDDGKYPSGLLLLLAHVLSVVIYGRWDYFTIPGLPSANIKAYIYSYN